MTSTKTTPAHAGCERVCAQCGAAYHSPRSTSRYCSTACRKKAHRQKTKKTAALAPPEVKTVVCKILEKLHYLGEVRHSDGSGEPRRLSLTIDAAVAYRELATLYDTKGWGILTRPEFNEALKADGISRRP